MTKKIELTAEQIADECREIGEQFVFPGIAAFEAMRRGIEIGRAEAQASEPFGWLCRSSGGGFDFIAVKPAPSVMRDLKPFKIYTAPQQPQPVTEAVMREACAQKCEQRADSLTDGSDVARLCARDIRNGASPQPQPESSAELREAPDLLAAAKAALRTLTILSEESDCNIDPFTFGRYGGDKSIRDLSAAVAAYEAKRGAK